MKKQLEQGIKELNQIREYINDKYFEVEDFVDCILLSLVSKTNMIALGMPGIAKSAILREFVDSIDFSNTEGTPYFQIQMGADISPNNVFGAPDINYFKENGIIKRHYQGFLPDAIIAFCSEFYRISDQVANSGILSILNEGEFKNGVETIKTKLRFFMADTNFFPKQEDDLDFEEEDLRLMALHDRFLSRVFVKPISEKENKINMLLMDDKVKSPVSIPLKKIIEIQDYLDNVELPYQIASSIINISEELYEKHQIFLSPRRIKMSRNLVKASALLNLRDKCNKKDLHALRFSFWQKEDDITKCKEAIIKEINRTNVEIEKCNKLVKSIKKEFDNNVSALKLTGNGEIEIIRKQALSDLDKIKTMIDDEGISEINTSKNLIDSIKEIEKEILAK